MHIKRPLLYCYSIGSIGLYSIPNLWRLCFLQDRHISLPFSQISPSYSQVKQQQKVLILSLCIWHRQLWIFWILGVPPPSSPVGRLCYLPSSPRTSYGDLSQSSSSRVYATFFLRCVLLYLFPMWAKPWVFRYISYFLIREKYQSES